MPHLVEPRVRVNPEGLDAAGHAEFLTQCFGTPWSREMYRWYLQRPFAGLATDRLILTVADSAVAGCGLAYRFLRTPDRSLHRVGVIVSAATLPVERGRGHYARLLQTAVDLGAARGCVALLGFVTAANATGRGLQRRGAIRVASAYVVTGPSARVRRPAALQLGAAPATRRWHGRAPLAGSASDSERFVRFHYPDMREWRAQYLERPHGIESIHLGTNTRALVESVGDTDRLQWLGGALRERPAAIASLAERAMRAARQFFMYSTLPADCAAASRLGLRVVPGYLMVLATTDRHRSTVSNWGALPWLVQSGDRL